MSLLTVIKKNPLATITTAIAIAGVVVGILNFYILTRIEPLADRVKAVEVEHSQITEQLEEHEGGDKTTRENIATLVTEVSNIKVKLDRIDNKLDSLFIPRVER